MVQSRCTAYIVKHKEVNPVKTIEKEFKWHKRPYKHMDRALQMWRPNARFHPIVVRRRTGLDAPPPPSLCNHASAFTEVYLPSAPDWKHSSSLIEKGHTYQDGRTCNSWELIGCEEEPYSMLSWRAFWTCHIGARLITLPSPVLKYLLSCVSIPPIIHHWSAVTKALGGLHENCCWYWSN